MIVVVPGDPPSSTPGFRTFPASLTLDRGLKATFTADLVKKLFKKNIFLLSVNILLKQVPGRGPEQRESIKTVLYRLIISTILISCIIIKLLIKMRTFPAKTEAVFLVVCDPSMNEL